MHEDVQRVAHHGDRKLLASRPDLIGVAVAVQRVDTRRPAVRQLRQHILAAIRNCGVATMAILCHTDALFSSKGLKGLAMSEQPTIQQHRLWHWRWWNRERGLLAVELLGFFGVLAGLAAAFLSLNSATEQLQAAYDQVYESRFQAVFEEQLDLWQLTLEHPESGAHLMVGTPLDATPSPEEVVDTKRAAIVSSALDFYVYVWSLAPRDDDGHVPGGLDPGSVPTPEGISDADWQAWATWASTIVQGFEGAPHLCVALSNQVASYGEDFVMAVREETGNCVGDR